MSPVEAYKSAGEKADKSATKKPDKFSTKTVENEKERRINFRSGGTNFWPWYILQRKRFPLEMMNIGM